jgi:hypothetical protein
MGVGLLDDLAATGAFDGRAGSGIAGAVLVISERARAGADLRFNTRMVPSMVNIQNRPIIADSKRLNDLIRILLTLGPKRTAN